MRPADAPTHAQILADNVNYGYDGLTPAIVRAVNGTPIRSLPHLCTILRDCREPYVSWGM